MASDMPNLRGLIDTLAGLRTDTAWSIAITLVSSILVFWVTQRRVRRGDESLLHQFALATIAAILVSYHALPYDLVLLFPAVLVLLAKAISENMRLSRSDIGLLILFFLTPLYVLLWLRLNQFAWFGLPLIWLLWRLSRSSSADESVFREAT
jgi:glucan phosphoethanolaminetransferase (alkaline phosphatase superfamily)